MLFATGVPKIDDDEQINAKDQSIFKHHQTLNVYWYGLKRYFTQNKMDDGLPKMVPTTRPIIASQIISQP